MNTTKRIFVYGLLLTAAVIIYPYYVLEEDDSSNNLVYYMPDDTLVITGEVNPTLYHKVAAEIKPNQNIFIESTGGNVGSAWDIAYLFESNKVNVTVGEFGCWSACTIIIASRPIDQQGPIGIHAATFMDKQNVISRRLDRNIAEFYRMTGHDEWADYLLTHNTEFKVFK